MAETYDFKEGFKRGWRCLWTIMSAVDLLMGFIPKKDKKGALTAALTLKDNVVVASEFYDEEVTRKLRIVEYTHYILLAIISEDWDRALRETELLKNRLPF